MMINYGVDTNRIIAIYYGTPDDREVLWTPGTELPALTYQELTEMHDSY